MATCESSNYALYIWMRFANKNSLFYVRLQGLSVLPDISYWF